MGQIQKMDEVDELIYDLYKLTEEEKKPSSEISLKQCRNDFLHRINSFYTRGAFYTKPVGGKV